MQIYIRLFSFTFLKTLVVISFNKKLRIEIKFLNKVMSDDSKSIYWFKTMSISLIKQYFFALYKAVSSRYK